MPALAIAAAFRAAHPASRVALVGAQRGIEARLLPSRDFPFTLLAAEPIYRRQWWKNLRWPFLLPGLLRQVDRLLDEERPGFVLGTGGYAAGPVVWRAARRGIRTAMLELNAYPGLAVRWLAKSVNELWLGSPEARAHLKPGARTEVIDTGVPITPPDPALRPEAMQRYGLDPARLVLLITGGSQGAQALNQVVADWLQSGGSERLQVLWSTGKAGYARFAALQRPPAVQVFEFLDPIGPAYSVADLALTRAGMMTVAELCAWGIPAILVPLPTAAADHQTPNAQALAAAGGAIHLPQQELSVARLSALLDSLRSDAPRREAMRSAALGRARPGAMADILERIGVSSG